MHTHSDDRERRLLFLESQEMFDIVHQAESEDQTPLQTFDVQIAAAAKKALQSIDAVYAQRSSWYRNTEKHNKAEATQAANAITGELLHQAHAQAERERDKSILAIHNLAAQSQDTHFFHTLRLRTIEESLRAHRERKDALQKALRQYVSLAQEAGIPMSAAALETHQRRIESLDARTVRYEQLLTESRATVDAQKQSAGFAELAATEEKLRGLLLKCAPVLAKNQDLERLIRGAINNDGALETTVMRLNNGQSADDVKDMLDCIHRLGGRSSTRWLWKIPIGVRRTVVDRQWQALAADYYSARLLEKRDLNPRSSPGGSRPCVHRALASVCN